MWLRELLAGQNNIALRWSARLRKSLGYKHLAPLGRRTQNDLCCTSKLNSQMTNGKFPFFLLPTAPAPASWLWRPESPAILG
jgi:hypothetical protein